MEEGNNNIFQENAMPNNNNNVQVAPIFNVDAFFNSLPSGFRFLPTDEELIMFYLDKKVKGEELPVNRFRDININENDPDDFTKEYKLLRESEWYVFTSRQKKYPNGSRPDRVTKGGYWKATGTVKEIKSNGEEIIGYRRNLDFFTGRPNNNGTKTDWKMHEYLLKDPIASPPNDATLRIEQIDPVNDAVEEASDKNKLNDWVLCKIYKNTRTNKGKDKKNKSSETTDSEQGQEVPVPVTKDTTHAFPGQPGAQLPENHQDQVPMVPQFTNVASRPFYSHHHPDVHFGMSSSPTFNHNPLHYAPFENGALWNSCHNQNLDMGQTSHHVMNSSPSFAMQDYSAQRGLHNAIRDGSRISEWVGPEYGPAHEARGEDGYFNYDDYYAEGGGSFDDEIFDQYLSPPDDAPHEKGKK